MLIATIGQHTYSGCNIRSQISFGNHIVLFMIVDSIIFSVENVAVALDVQQPHAREL